MNICEYYLQNFNKVTNESALWIQRMRSSFSNFNKKLIYGNSYDFGDFDSCVTTKINHRTDAVGKYCLIKYHSDDVIPVPPTQSIHNLRWPNLDENFGGAICVPHTCGSDVINSLTNTLFNGTSYSLTRDYDQEEFCQVREQIVLNNSDYAVISIFLLYLLAILLITWRSRKLDVDDDSFLSSFSILSNLRSLFEVRKNSMQYLSLIRTILYIGLVAFHSFFLRAYYPVVNSEKMLRFMDHSFTKILSVAPLGLMGFFVISSALATRKFLILLDNKSFNLTLIIVERYIRTMVVVAVIIFSNIFINNLHIYQAPYYFPDQQSEGCRKNWWTTMLLIQNYYHTGVKEMCAPQCWFLSANFHFFLLTPFVIYPIWKWMKTAFIIFPVLILASVGIVVNFTIQQADFLKQIDFFSITNDNFSGFYLQTHYLAAGWIIGMIVGIIFYKYKEIDMHQIVKFLMYAFIAFTIFKLFILKFFLEPEMNILLSSFDRLAVSVSAGCFLILGNYSRAEKLKRIAAGTPISLVWIVIDRLGLSLYLVHEAVIIGSIVILKQPLTFDIIPIIITIFSDFFLSLLLAAIVHLLFEQPAMRIMKKIITAKFMKQKESTNV